MYSTPRDGVMAAGEQAFCDFIHVCRKRGVRASSLVTFRNMDRLDRQSLAEILIRYPVAARREATRLLAKNGLMMPG